MTKLIERSVMGLAARLPRGGYAVARLASRILPGLRNYPARLPFTSVPLRGDVALNVFYPLAVKGYYGHQLAEDDLFALLAREATCIVDVGANIGFTAALFATFAPPSCRILAYEPLPRCRPFLDQVTAAWPNVEVRAKAVGARDEVAQFVERRNLDRSSIAGKGDPDAVTGTVEVPVVTLDRDLSGVNVDVLKIDVEGFEAAVIEGARELIRTSRPCVVFEAYEIDVRDQCWAFFQDMGDAYELFVIGERGTLVPVEKAVGRDDVTCNFAAWPRHRPKPDALRVPAAYRIGG